MPRRSMYDKLKYGDGRRTEQLQKDAPQIDKMLTIDGYRKFWAARKKSAEDIEKIIADVIYDPNFEKNMAYIKKWNLFYGYWKNPEDLDKVLDEWRNYKPKVDKGFIYDKNGKNIDEYGPK